MLTRSRARASNQHVFVDDRWNDVYIQTKDEQIELLHAQGLLKGWEADGEGEGADEDSDEEETADEERWQDEEEEDDELDFEQENVKRRSWVQTWLAAGTWGENVVWTVLTSTIVPFGIYALYRWVFRGRTKRSPWPLASKNCTNFLLKMLLNMLALSVILTALYWTTCGGLRITFPLPPRLWEWPRHASFDSVNNCLRSLVHGLQNCVATARTSRWLSFSCFQLVIRSMVLGTVVTLLGQFHRAWFKLLVLLTLPSILVTDQAVRIRQARRAAVKIISLDPSVVFVNETIFVAIDGQNLEQGGDIAWIRYWGGLQSQNAQDCVKYYTQPLYNGGVLATFEQVNEYVPCYRDAAHHADPLAYQCYEDLHLRVKHPRSVPGWSLQDAYKSEL